MVCELLGGGVALYPLDALDRARLALVGLAGGDHLAVGGDQVEAELAGRALLEHELGRHTPSLGWSVLARAVSNRPPRRLQTALVQPLSSPAVARPLASPGQ